jgi:hypothetical protein
MLGIGGGISIVAGCMTGASSRRGCRGRAAATTINVLFAMNTMFGLAMRRADGMAHDRSVTNGMRWFEFLVGTAYLALFVALARRVRGAPADGPSLTA